MAKSTFQIAMKAKTIDDFKKYLRRVRRSQSPLLTRAAAFVRTAARSSIRPGGKKGKVSEPGKPPRSHNGLLKKFIMFAVDKKRQTAWIGPLKLNQKIGNAPSALESGGKSKVPVFRPRGRTGRRTGPKTRTITVRARPYMGPALKKEMPKFAKLWRGSVK